MNALVWGLLSGGDLLAQLKATGRVARALSLHTQATPQNEVLGFNTLLALENDVFGPMDVQGYKYTPFGHAPVEQLALELC